jgi:hypothetical protein
LQGLGAGFVPSILDITLLDGVITVGKDEAYEYAINAAKKEGLFVEFLQEQLWQPSQNIYRKYSLTLKFLLSTTPERYLSLRDSSNSLNQRLSMKTNIKSPKVYLIGAGPGNPD